MKFLLLICCFLCATSVRAGSDNKNIQSISKCSSLLLGASKISDELGAILTQSNGEELVRFGITFSVVDEAELGHFVQKASSLGLKVAGNPILVRLAEDELQKHYGRAIFVGPVASAQRALQLAEVESSNLAKTVYIPAVGFESLGFNSELGGDVMDLTATPEFIAYYGFECEGEKSNSSFIKQVRATFGIKELILDPKKGTLRMVMGTRKP